MAAPASMFESENSMEERIARLETPVGHTRSDTADIKSDIRRLDGKLDRLDEKIGGLDEKVDGTPHNLNSLALTMQRGFDELSISRSYDRIRWLLMFGVLLGALAHGFHSI
jgi:chromosome segregation ATPase